MTSQEKTRRLVAVAALGAALLALPVLVSLAKRHWQARTPATVLAGTWTAYTIHQVERARYPSGDERVLRLFTIAQRADGVRAEISVNHPGRPTEIVERTILYPDGTRVIAYDRVGLRSTIPPHARSAEFARGRMLGRRTAESDCLLNYRGEVAARGTRVAERGSRSGLAAVRIVDEQADLSAWHAPGLGCEAIELSKGFRAAGVFSDWSERATTSHAVGEPDSAYFDVSALRETSPAEARVAQYRATGAPDNVLAEIRRTMAGLERRYAETR